MCIAVYKPKDMQLLDETLENCWDNNPDGGGFMYVHKSKVVIEKGFMTFEDFMEAYKPHEFKEVVLHFRIATHGDVDDNNTHPFAISPTLGVVHNGILSKVACNIDKKWSDTWHFVENYLKEFHKKDKSFFLKPSFQHIIEDYIDSNKLIFMDGRGNCTIYNESVGTWNSECWFSNTSYSRKASWGKVIPKKDIPSVWSYKKALDFHTLVVGDLVETNAVLYPNRGFDVIPLYTKVKLRNIGRTDGPHWSRVVCVEEESTGTTVWCEAWKLNMLPPEEKIATLPNLYDFKVGKNVIFIKNYNHFRIGNKRLVSKLSVKDSLYLLDDTDKQEHLVPMSVIKPAFILSH